jgi:hypothetical protein
VGRRGRARRPAPRSGPAPAADREPEGSAGEDWAVRPITGSATTKTYRCPGCDQEIRPGTPHVVSWPVGDPDAARRRHWHTACWQARFRRR